MVGMTLLIFIICIKNDNILALHMFYLTLIYIYLSEHIYTMLVGVENMFPKKLV